MPGFSYRGAYNGISQFSKSPHVELRSQAMLGPSKAETCRGARTRLSSLRQTYTTRVVGSLLEGKWSRTSSLADTQAPSESSSNLPKPPAISDRKVSCEGPARIQTRGEQSSQLKTALECCVMHNWEPELESAGIHGAQGVSWKDLYKARVREQWEAVSLPTAEESCASAAGVIAGVH